MPAPRDFAEVVQAAAQTQPCSFVVAGGEAEEIVEAIDLCKAHGIEGFTLVGQRQPISWLLATHVLDDEVLLHESDDPVTDALELCATLPRPVLVKGKVDSASLLRGVLGSLPKEHRPFVSHCTVLKHPTAHKLLVMTDAGLNVAPDKAQKAGILQNGLNLLRAMGIEQPRVLLAAGMEDKGQPLSAITDAKALVAAHHAGLWPDAVIDGPYGLDVGLAPQAVAAKGLGGALGGAVDMVVAPNIEAANFAAKMAGIINGPPWAGLIVGGPLPVVVGSRSDPPESRVASLALARLVAGKLPPGTIPSLPAE
jgi:phosphotransacetylase